MAVDPSPTKINAVPTSRELTTNLGAYDQIIAIPQKCLNDNLAAYWQRNPDVATFNFNDGPYGSLKGTLNPPTIELDVGTGGQPSLHFNLNFAEGELVTYVTGTWDDPQTFPLKDCVFSFIVSIDAHKIGGDDQAKWRDDILNRLHFDGENFSVNRLFMDLTSQGYNWGNTFSDWMTKQMSGGLTTLGYSITANESVPVVATKATFHPNFNEFQTSPWISSPTAVPVEGPEGWNNCLCYLQTTGTTPKPGISDLLYKWSGNLCDDPEQGTMIMSKRLIWTQWLLPHLAFFNFGTEILATDVHCSGNEAAPNFRATCSVGANADMYDAARYNAADDARPTNYSHYLWTEKPEGLGYTWDSGESRMDDSGGTWGSALNTYISCRTKNDISFDVNTAVVHVSGEIYCKVHQWSDAGLGADAEIKGTWGFDIEMGGPVYSDDGVKAVGIPISLQNIQGPSVSSSSKDDGGANDAPGGIKKVITTQMATLKFQVWCDTLQSALSGVDACVLPGEGTFKMANPVFNTEGDWLYLLTYVAPANPEHPEHPVPPPSSKPGNPDTAGH